MELLTHEIAYTYRDRAKALPYNGMQDIGERRALRIELQERCGVTELEAVNIINGFHIVSFAADRQSVSIIYYSAAALENWQSRTV